MADDKAIVAAVRTTPETILEDYERVMKLAGFEEALDPTKQTILKNNIMIIHPFFIGRKIYICWGTVY